MAKLHMDSLTKQPHRKALRLALENLPPELDDTYEDALTRINAQHKEDTKIAHQTLGWMTHATRPLSMKQLQHAISVEPEQTDLDEETLIDEELLISTCLGLITVDHTSKEVRLVHYTAQKYFEHRLLDFLPDNHPRIASTCLTYMSFKTCLGIDEFTSDKEIKALEDRYPFLDYAGSNWGVHAQRNDQSLVQQILQSLSPRATYLSSRLMIGGFKSLTHEYTHKHWDYPVKYEARISGHNMAAYFGLQHTLMTLLSEASDNRDMIDSILLICSARGHQNLVKILLGRGANINNCSWLGWTPLHLASAKGNLAMTKLLLGTNADVNKRQSLSSSTSLQRAAETGYAEVLQALFDAVFQQQEAIVNPLLDRGADVAIGDAMSLSCAVSVRNGRMVSLLSKDGADLRVPGALKHSLEKDWWYPSHKVISEESLSKKILGQALMLVESTPEPVSVAEILIKSGADINLLSINEDLLDYVQEGEDEWRLQSVLGTRGSAPLLDFPLLAACRSENEPLVRLLLDRGAKLWGVEKETWLQEAIGFNYSGKSSLQVYGTIIGSDDLRKILRKNAYSEGQIDVFDRMGRQIENFVGNDVLTRLAKEVFGSMINEDSLG